MREALQLLLELVGWGVAGVRSVVADSRRERREEKAEARSAQREADLLKRFEYPLCACTHRVNEHTPVDGLAPCMLCGCTNFRESRR